MSTIAKEFPDNLQTDTLEERFALAVKLSRLGVKQTQPNMDVLQKLRPDYAEDANSLITVSHVIAVHFQTISGANNGWRQSDGNWSA
jgi:hypothetical protein